MAVTFRAGVGMVVLDDSARVLALERAAVPGAWQLPQGGIEGDEEPVDALWRELREETGLTSAHVHLLGETAEWLGYELPADFRSRKTGRGQVHKWFFLDGGNGELPVRLDLVPHVEFRAWQWIPLSRLAEQAVAFRQPVYRRLVELAALLR